MHEIKNYLTETRELTELKHTLDELKRNPEAYALTAKFREKRESLNKPGLNEESVNRLMFELERDYESLRKYHAINAYFEAEERFGALMENLISSINAEITSELGI